MRLSIDLPGSPARTSVVSIGGGQLEDLPGAVESNLEGRTAYWIWDEKVWALWEKRLSELGWPDWDRRKVVLFAASEANKRLGVLEELARELVQAGADRKSALIAVGGGVTGDVVGFLASIYMRGIPCFQIPTTLLAQVDSSIGGKTGVDLPEGKNLLGTFYQPQAIWMAPEFLDTLPAEEFRQGMAEIIKTAMIGDSDLWDYLENGADALKRRDSEALTRVITACCILKARVVESDEKESGYRRVLNLGHTVGHAVEKLCNYQMHHGDAVAMGLVAAARLSVRLGELEEKDSQRLEKLCAVWQLPVRLPKSFSADDVLSTIRSDKKHVQGVLHFILPIKIGEVADRSDLNMEVLRQVVADLQEA